MRKIRRKDELRRSLIKGIDLASDIVAETSGPHGRNVMLGEKNITNDGVSIIKEIEFPDVFENAGVILLKDVATKTNNEAGDGTTGTVILTRAQAKDSQKHLESGLSVQEIRKSLQEAGKKAIKLLEKSANKTLDVFNVAKISSESTEIAQNIDNIFTKIGLDGVIKVEKSTTSGLVVEYSQGLEFGHGLLSPYMMNDKENRRYSGKDVPVITVAREVTSPDELIPVLERIRTSGINEAVLIANNASEEVLQWSVQNIVEETFKLIIIKSPGFDNPDLLMDICALAGTEDDINVIGKLESVVATESTTTISDQRDVSKRVKELKSRTPKDNFDKKKLQDRIAQLSGGVATIKVGASTDVETAYLQDKVEDAIKAVKSSIEEGVVAGGGSELVRISHKIGNKTVGEQILSTALQAPCRQMAKNAGLDDGVIVENLKTRHGFNFETGEYVDDMFKAGIIDPLKVIRASINNSISAVSTLLTTNTAIIYEPDKK